MQRDIWDINGAIPMLGPTSGPSLDQSNGPALDHSVMTFDDGVGEEEPVDPAAVVAISLLSPREHEVLQELVDGKSHDAAAEDLYISPHTFRTHVKNILTKLGAHSSIEAVSIAVCAGVRPTRMQEQTDATEHAGDETTGSGSQRGDGASDGERS
jgi:DNA-binding CsgD family transcriptional regulator